MTYDSNWVGPVLRHGDVANACILSIYDDNPGSEIKIEQHHSYVRLHAQAECRLKRTTVEQNLGRPFAMQEIEHDLCSFAGRIETTSEGIRFYLANPSSRATCEEGQQEIISRPLEG
jgi:toluene monooxygenase system protein D